jgi:hypothetical protein
MLVFKEQTGLPHAIFLLLCEALRVFCMQQHLLPSALAFLAGIYMVGLSSEG